LFSAFIDNYDDAMSEMSDNFIMGTLRGSFIHKLLSLTESILRQMFNFQMRVPAINDKNVIEAAMETEKCEEKIGLIDFSRPSDYRMKAIEARNAGIYTADDVSHLSGTSRLSTVATSIDSLKTGNQNTPYEGKMSINKIFRVRACEHFYTLRYILFVKNCHPSSGGFSPLCR
jgi:hypothetical protein